MLNLSQMKLKIICAVIYKLNIFLVDQALFITAMEVVIF